MALLHTPAGAAPGQVDRVAAPVTTARRGQEGHGLVVRGDSLPYVLPGQEGQEQVRWGGPGTPKIPKVAGPWQYPVGQDGQGIRLLGAANFASPTGFAIPHHSEQLLFKLGVLEALSGAVAARLANANADTSTAFMFNAKKKPI